MKTSFAALALALSGSAVGAPFSSGTHIESNSSAASTPIHLSTDRPLPSLFNTLSTEAPSSPATPSSGSRPLTSAPIPSGSGVKRGEAISIPTDIPSLASDAQSVAAALASLGAGAQKRGESLSIPTDIPSLLADAQSIGSAIASAGAQKRGESLSIPTDLPSVLSDAQSAAAALASAGVQKRGESLSIPTDLPSLLADAQSVGSAIVSAGAQKRGDETLPLLTPTATTPTTPLGTGLPKPFGTYFASSSGVVSPPGYASSSGITLSSVRPLV
ncbi:hypothetical protein PENNAL_c0002G05695 [Penicillium nalgiovense]|nr:hypothetical protein PENNAL_c0002G05695 [Penicillium nalgiovense]CAG8109326.1 unnamed protein product [Penicillium nalgiovense]